MKIIFIIIRGYMTYAMTNKNPLKVAISGFIISWNQLFLFYGWFYNNMIKIIDQYCI